MTYEKSRIEFNQFNTFNNVLYAIINTKKGEEQGFLALSHRTLSKGNKMIVNENELRLVDEDLMEAVKKLGGTELLTNSELHNTIKNSK